jgi:site-specific DNA recombinase
MTAPRAALYVRVSSEEQVEGYSLEAQDRAGRLCCEAHGWQVVRVYREEGKSARTDDLAKRPQFCALLADAEAGLIDVVVVHKLDRFARNRRVAFEAFERLGRSGVGFVSITENMDYSTPAGQLMLTMLVGLAQFYSDNLSGETKKGKLERKNQGLYNGVLPFGVTKGSDGIPIADSTPRPRTDGVGVIVPIEGLQLAFALASGGKTDREVAQALNDAGYRTSGNRGANRFTKDSMRVILQNRFYLGELPDGSGGYLPGLHAAVIEPQLFEAAELARARNTRRPRRTGLVGQPWALSGVATCGTCGRSIVANGRPDGRRSLRCSGRIQGIPCDEPSFYEELLSAQLHAIMSRFAFPVTDQQQLMEAWLRRQNGGQDQADQRQRLQRRQNRLKELYLSGDIEREEYQQQRAQIAEDLAALPTETTSAQDIATRLAEYLANIGLAWADATPEQQNRIARELFSEAIIENRTIVAVKPRSDLLPFFQAVNWCVGGSDGDRNRRCVTLKAISPLQSRRSSDRWGVPAAPRQARHARASSRPIRRRQSACWQPRGVSAPLPLTVASATRP